MGFSALPIETEEKMQAGSGALRPGSGRIGGIGMGITMLYLTNSPILPLPRGTTNASILASVITLEEARKFLAEVGEFTSAIGHKATADALSLLLGIQIPVNRVQIVLDPRDQILAFSLHGRLEEGKVITDVQEILDIGLTITYILRLP